MKKLLLFLSIAFIAGCSKIEPIQVTASERQIDTKSMEQYKSNLEARRISVGLIYGWGKADKSNLMNTPDSLDVIVVKDGYKNMSDYQKQDLANAQTLKATKVLAGTDLETMALAFEEALEKKISERQKEKQEELKKGNEYLTDDELKAEMNRIRLTTINEMVEQEKEILKKVAAEIIEIIQKEKFNGISIEVPQNFNAAYSAANISAFIEEVSKVAGKGKSHMLIVENPFEEAKALIENAQWVLFRQKAGKPLFSGFDMAAAPWTSSRFLPSVDFSKEDITEGFGDSKSFSPTGIIPQALDVVNWAGTNMGGVAYYHIENNYTDMTGKMSYTTLRHSINKLQLTK